VPERAAEPTGDAKGATAEQAEDATADDRAGEAEDATADDRAGEAEDATAEEAA
jgi:hypothetical protein